MEKFVEKYGKYQGAYSIEKLSIKMKRNFKKFGYSGIYRAILLAKFLKRRKAKSSINIVAMAALGYFISPIDVIPDIIIGTGLIDDAAVLITACSLLKDKFTWNMKSDSCKAILRYFKNEEVAIPLI